MFLRDNYISGKTQKSIFDWGTVHRIILERKLRLVSGPTYRSNWS